ncbi:MAG: acyltransferase [Clostridia bacterium]|nr:acyltransferase [Clostridia bacterium]
MNTTHETSRLGRIDAARGIGIILVVLGHAIRPGMVAEPWCDFLFRLIYSFHMPLFFVLSGFTFALTCRKYISAPVTFLKKRTHSLLIPLLTWAATIYLCFFVAYRIPPIGAMLESSSFEWIDPLRYLYLTFVWENPYAAHLWYLWVLLVITLVAFLIARLFRGAERWRTVLLLLSLPCFVIALLFPIPTALRKMSAYLLFFAVGALLERFSERLLKPRALTTVISLISTALLIAVTLLSTAGILPDSRTPLLLKNLLLTVAVFPAILGLLQLCDRLSSLRLLTAAGRGSFAVYLLHQPFCCGFAGIVLYDRLGLPSLPVLVLCTALSFCFPSLVVWLSRRVRWIGRITHALLNI